MLSLIPLPQLVQAGGVPFRLASRTGLSGVPEPVAGWLRERTGLALEGSGATALEFSLGADGPPESYRLTVDQHGVRATAPDAAGLFYAGCTVVQLLAETPDGWTLPAVTIQDAPRFGYRGAMLDVARHFFEVAVVKRFIDRIARLKLNRLHLHLSDDQGWRIEIASRPELTAKASGTAVGGDPGGFFTQADYAELVRYAAARQITIVPEIDLPGHTHAVGLAYPELAEAPVLSDHVMEMIHGSDGVVPAPGEPFTGVAVGFSSLRIDDEAGYEFIADVLGELAALTPGPYLHIGGDECLGTPPEAFARFLRRVTAMVAELGKTPVAWHEAGAVAGLATGTVGQYWGFLQPNEIARACVDRLVGQGSKLILSPADAVYLDMKPDADRPLGVLWTGGPTSLERSYSWDPSTLVEGLEESSILGVEAPLWTEKVVTPEHIDALVFPRLMAAAEIAWSEPLGTPGRTWPDFQARLAGLGS